MDNHTLTVIPGTWTVDEFDKRVRGLRAALIAYGDVFKTNAAPVVVAQAPTPVLVQPKAPTAQPIPLGEIVALPSDGIDVAIRNVPAVQGEFRHRVLTAVLELKLGERIFVHHKAPRRAQSAVLNRVQQYCKQTNQTVRVTTAIAPVGENPGLYIRRVA